ADPHRAVAGGTYPALRRLRPVRELARGDVHFHGLGLAGSERHAVELRERADGELHAGGLVARRTEVHLHHLVAGRRPGVLYADGDVEAAVVGLAHGLLRELEGRVREPEPERELGRDPLLVEEAVARVDALGLDRRAA